MLKLRAKATEPLMSPEYHKIETSLAFSVFLKQHTPIVLGSLWIIFFARTYTTEMNRIIMRLMKIHTVKKTWYPASWVSFANSLKPEIPR